MKNHRWARLGTMGASEVGSREWGVVSCSFDSEMPHAHSSTPVSTTRWNCQLSTINCRCPMRQQRVRTPHGVELQCISELMGFSVCVALAAWKSFYCILLRLFSPHAVRTRRAQRQVISVSPARASREREGGSDSPRPKTRRPQMPRVQQTPRHCGRSRRKHVPAQKDVGSPSAGQRGDVLLPILAMD